MMIDIHGLVLADNVQQAERNLLELDSVDWVEVKAELESVEFANAFMDKEGYLTLAEDVKDFPAFLQKQCEKDKSSQRFWFFGCYKDD
mgnify:CR=1 FL=1